MYNALVRCHYIPTQYYLLILKSQYMVQKLYALFNYWQISKFFIIRARLRVPFHRYAIMNVELGNLP